MRMNKYLTSYQRYLLKKFGWYLLTFVVALGLNFLLPRLVPGNPVAEITAKVTLGMADSSKMDSIYQAFMDEFNLNEPLWKQFLLYIKGVLKGDLGTSFTMYPRKVFPIILDALPWSIGLMLPSLFIGWIVGNLLGAFAAYKKGIFDKVVFPITLFILKASLPTRSYTSIS